MTSCATVCCLHLLAGMESYEPRLHNDASAVMDWRNDAMCGVGDDSCSAGMLVASYQQQAVGRSVYLPHAPHGTTSGPGSACSKQIQSDAPLNRIRFTFALERSCTRPKSNMLIRNLPIQLNYVSTKARWNVRLYDDNGDGYEYEQGERAVIQSVGRHLENANIGRSPAVIRRCRKSSDST